jgi:hypothetical protein
METKLWFAAQKLFGERKPKKRTVKGEKALSNTFSIAMRAIETNVLVRLIVRHDPRQTAGAESFIRGGAWISVLALAEAVWVLATVYRLSSRDLATAIEMLLESSRVGPARLSGL